MFFFVKQKTAYELRISDWSSDVCSSDLSPALLPLARAIFVDQAGYEAPISSDVLSAGELDEVLKAGYAPAAGVFGIHRFHHVADDDERCLDVPATTPAAPGFRGLIEAVSLGRAQSETNDLPRNQSSPSTFAPTP